MRSEMSGNGVKESKGGKSRKRKIKVGKSNRNMIFINLLIETHYVVDTWPDFRVTCPKGCSNS